MRNKGELAMSILWQKGKRGSDSILINSEYLPKSFSTPVIKVKNNKSGLIYLLRRNGAEDWYIMANDGIVPSGQAIYGFCFKKLLDSIDCSIVEA